MNKQPLCAMGVLALLLAPAVWAQQGRTSEQAKVAMTSGEVISMSRESLVVRSREGQQRTFVVGEETELPNPLIPGSGVRVEYETQEDGTLRALNVVLNVFRAPQFQPMAASGSEEQEAEAVAADVREVDVREAAVRPSQPDPQSSLARDGLRENQTGDGLPAAASLLPLLLLVGGFLVLAGGIVLRSLRRS